MLPLGDTCDEGCSMPVAHPSISTLAVYSLPFLVTFVGVGWVAFQKLFPAVSGLQQTKEYDDHYLPSDAPPSLRLSHKAYTARSSRRKLVATTFSFTIALAAVLAELILCEISDLSDRGTRGYALRTILPTLLFLLVVLIPLLELASIISGCGLSFRVTKDGRIPKTPWVLQMLGFSTWLIGFWYVGERVLGAYATSISAISRKELGEGCLERVGIIGISLMALLSGFAAISAPWQTFGIRRRPVSSADVARKQAGLDSCNDMLAAKRSRLRALQKKFESTPSEGLVNKVIGSVRGNADMQESRSLELEISGLESMAIGLSSSHRILENRLNSEERASSPFGKVFLIPTSYAFSLYCLCRIATTTLATLRRYILSTPTSDDTSASSSDPINRILSLLAENVDPSLDRVAWSRQISFFLSGIILFASFNSVLQTFHMLTKLLPSLLYQAQANLALIIAQVSATYVISSALLLRSNLPPEMKSVVSEALGSPLDPGFVDRWFEGWFMVAAIGTAVGIWVGRKVASDELDDWDDLESVEMGQKML